MKLVLKLAAIFGLALPAGLSAQTCSTSNPCVGVQVTTTVPSNVGNSTATLYACNGGAAGCNATTLAAFIANPGPSQWRNLGTFPQTATTVTYNDPEAYGSLMNYAALNTPTSGGAGPVSAIWIFQVPTQTQTSPSLKFNPTLTTTGSAGPQ